MAASPCGCPDTPESGRRSWRKLAAARSEEHTSELQSRQYLVCRLLLEKKNVALTVGVFLLLFGAGLWAFTRMGHRFAMVERGVGLVKKKRRIAFSVFFFNDTATTEIYTLSLHDALPISRFSGPEISQVFPMALG